MLIPLNDFWEVGTLFSNIWVSKKAKEPFSLASLPTMTMPTRMRLFASPISQCTRPMYHLRALPQPPPHTHLHFLYHSSRCHRKSKASSRSQPTSSPLAELLSFFLVCFAVDGVGASIVASGALQVAGQLHLDLDEATDGTTLTIATCSPCTGQFSVCCTRITPADLFPPESC